MSLRQKSVANALAYYYTRGGEPHFARMILEYEEYTCDCHADETYGSHPKVACVSIKCQTCTKISCHHCLHACHCGRVACLDCFNKESKCGHCERLVCDECAGLTCDVCKETSCILRACGMQYRWGERCERRICVNCQWIHACANCGGANEWQICGDHAAFRICKTCNLKFCDKCFDIARCPTIGCTKTIQYRKTFSIESSCGTCSCECQACRYFRTLMCRLLPSQHNIFNGRCSNHSLVCSIDLALFPVLCLTVIGLFIVHVIQ